MIARILAWLTLYGILCNGVFGLPYSHVYVRSNAESSPIEYMNYGAPAYPLSAPLTASGVPPCVSPCVLPSGTVAALAPVAPVAPFTNANIVAYSPPIASGPVVIAPRTDDKSSYEYSYVVYDENTGDHKEQRELSDGSTVHGEYSLIQPDGYVREVKYTADDVKGFNAIIRNYLPSNLAEEKKENEKSNELPPCREVKYEALVEAPNEEKKSSESSQSKESNEKKVSMEGSKEEGGKEKSSKEGDSKEEKKGNYNEESKETESKESKEKGSEDERSKKEGSKQEIPNRVDSKKEDSQEEGSINENSKEVESQEILKKEEASKQENSKENKSSTSESESSKSDEKDSSAPESLPGSSEESKDEAARSEESSSSDYTVDIIKCIQAAMEKAKKKSGTYSPLTYIVIPSTPC